MAGHHGQATPLRGRDTDQPTDQCPGDHQHPDSIALNVGARTVATEPCVLARAIVRMQPPINLVGEDVRLRARSANTVG
jgi:hypothetical protein